MKTLVVARAQDGDWEGVYIDGELKEQGHHVHFLKLLELVVEHQPFESCSVRYVDESWLDDRGDLPDSIEEVEWDTSSEPVSFRC